MSCGRRVRTQRDPHALIAALYAAARASTSSSSTHSPPRSTAYEPTATSRHEPSDCSNATGRSSTDSRSDPIRQPRRVLVPRRARHRHRRSNAATLIRASRVDLADSALHAPQAGFDQTDFYPDLQGKAAVLTCRVAWNHPLPDGNKRAAWACLVLFIDLNDGTWATGQPNPDEAVDAMLRVASRLRGRATANSRRRATRSLRRKLPASRSLTSPQVTLPTVVTLDEAVRRLDEQSCRARRGVATLPRR